MKQRAIRVVLALANLAVLVAVTGAGFKWN
jgi:hypothetical protein